MPSDGQYVGGDYYSGSRPEILVPDDSVLKIRRRIKDGAHMPAILVCEWWCPTCQKRHEKVIEEKMLTEGSAFFVEYVGMKSYSWEYDKEKRPMTLYLAMPYTHEKTEIRQLRYEHSCKCASQLIYHGYSVIFPISMGHPIVEASDQDNPVFQTFETWGNVCLRMLEASDAMCILLLDGVKESVGVQAEIDHAKTLGEAYYSP